ncbi:hypothetical protein GAP32_385 [Cronobacter phage vB_CsaM_GAP32]|uniref:Uncharacterized protein n=1 Tax=Cronobacter phage vB_CsaM_GAP32 TaxID=1141136 RepID=K4F7P4_9CAUD|nr:hypothetical protein GAP32_385 [Cronobacter phage vB_CsaM_GAP32]AFC21837.1 hypothetical protein GAP32_385 [Cronobacter phage vB_CsaM_GAP32]
MFTKIENAEVLIKTAGGYKVLPVYTRNSNGYLYAKNGQMFIALLNSSVTSNAKMTWQEINIPVKFEKSNMQYANEES